MTATASAAATAVSVPPVDFDALHAVFQARAAALASTTAKIAAADALILDVVRSDISPAVFKGLAGVIGKSAGLDHAVLLKQMMEARAALSGAAIPPPGARPPSGMQNPEPAATPHPLARVLGYVANLIERQIVCNTHMVTAITLWAAGSYGARKAYIYPRLVFTSPTKGCGKSTGLGAVRYVSCTPLKADSVSPSSLFRLVPQCSPTLLIDEVDTFVSGNDEIRGMLNAGYECSGAVYRSVPTADGKDFTVAEFKVFCPVALAGIGGLPDTVLHRSIVITLLRAPARSVAGRKRPMRQRELEAWRAMVGPHLVAHADAIGRVMEAGTKLIPSELQDRAQDNWEPLLALADLAGEDWPDRARAAAIALSGTADHQSHREMLLADLNTLVRTDRLDAINAYIVWRNAGSVGSRPMLPQHIRSAAVVADLLKMEHRPWPEYGKDGRGMTPVRLASMLRPFQIAPVNHRMPIAAPSMIPGKPPARTEVVKVYSVAALRAVFRQYL